MTSRWACGWLVLTAVMAAGCLSSPDNPDATTIQTGSPSAASAGGTDILTFMHTVDDGADGILIVHTSVESVANRAKSVDYADRPMLLLREHAKGDGDDCASQVWYLLDPPVGAAVVTATLTRADTLISTLHGQTRILR